MLALALRAATRSGRRYRGSARVLTAVRAGRGVGRSLRSTRRVDGVPMLLLEDPRGESLDRLVGRRWM